MTENQEHAHSALRYTNNVMTRGSTTRFPNQLNIVLRACVDVGRDLTHYSFTRRPLFREREEDIIAMEGVEGEACNYFRHAARIAEMLKCGNCGEMASVAFFYLLRQGVRHISLIGYMSFPNDHATVIVGMSENRDLADTNTWGDDVWVCDPWLNRVFHRSFIPVNIRPHSPPTEI